MKTFTLTKSDGTTLGATVFTPSVANGRTLLISSATGVRQQFYYPFAAFFAEQGYHVYTFDYTGIGRSLTGDIRACTASYVSWVRDDFAAMVSLVREKHEQPVFVVGHSSGGHTLGMTEAARDVAAFVMVGSQQGNWRNYPLWYKGLVYAAFTTSMPLLTTLFGYFPAWLHGLGDDLPRGVLHDWQNVLLKPDGVRSVADAHADDSRQTVYESLTQPIHIISIEDDLLAPKKAADRLAIEVFPRAAMTRTHLVPAQLGVKSIGHFGFFRKSFQSSLWIIAADWLEKQAIRNVRTTPHETASV